MRKICIALLAVLMSVCVRAGMQTDKVAASRGVLDASFSVPSNPPTADGVTVVVQGNRLTMAPTYWTEMVLLGWQQARIMDLGTPYNMASGSGDDYTNQLWINTAQCSGQGWSATSYGYYQNGISSGGSPDVNAAYLAARYSFDTAAWTNDSVNNYDLFMVGAPTQDTLGTAPGGQTVYAVGFSGTSQNLKNNDFGAAISGQQNLSICYWLRSSTWNDNDGIFQIGGTWGAAMPAINNGFQANRLYPDFGKLAGTFFFAYTITNWVRVVNTYDGSTIKVYTNAVFAAQDSWASLPATTGPLALGAYYDNPYGLVGQLALFKIYTNKCFTPTEVTNEWTLAGGTSGPTGSLDEVSLPVCSNMVLVSTNYVLPVIPTNGTVEFRIEPVVATNPAVTNVDLLAHISVDGGTNWNDVMWDFQAFLMGNESVVHGIWTVTNQYGKSNLVYRLVLTNAPAKGLQEKVHAGAFSYSP
jgi:hypothetical protein